MCSAVPVSCTLWVALGWARRQEGGRVKGWRAERLFPWQVVTYGSTLQEARQEIELCRNSHKPDAELSSLNSYQHQANSFLYPTHGLAAHCGCIYSQVLVLGVHYNKEIAGGCKIVMCPLAHADTVSSPRISRMRPGSWGVSKNNRNGSSVSHNISSCFFMWPSFHLETRAQVLWGFPRLRDGLLVSQEWLFAQRSLHFLWSLHCIAVRSFCPVLTRLLLWGHPHWAAVAFPSFKHVTTRSW